MKCPKCDFEQPDGGESCLRCGLIFARLRSPALRPGGAAAGSGGARGGARLLHNFLAGIHPEENRPVLAGRGMVWLVLLLWGVRFMFTPVSGEAFSSSFMHLVNLPFHEAGHVLFSPFGRFVQVLGGTLGQLLVPLVVAVAFAAKGNHFAVSVGLWWLGQSFMDCAPYIDDARAGQLMLLGGVTGSEVEDYHDWENILTRLGMMRYDHLVARLFFGCGVIIMLAALAWGGYVLWRQWRRGRSSP